MRTQPILKALQAWMNETLTQVSAKSPLARAIGYAVALPMATRDRALRRAATSLGVASLGEATDKREA